MSRFHATEAHPPKLSMQDMAEDVEPSISNAKLGLNLEKERPGSLSASLPSFDNDEPTEEERATLRCVSDKLPWAAFLVAVIELCERFTYYGLSGPFQNYIQHGYDDPSGLPGALGRFNSDQEPTPCGTWADILKASDKLVPLGLRISFNFGVTLRPS